ncbi:hypothetical protein [Kribbella sp. NPDC049227]|uniref:ApeA N-terminal domain 1-containing protein n=1 Tax=Kribbella sp. NPDC049227 TaxID=3364113 RepID=UPI003718A809
MRLFQGSGSVRVVGRECCFNASPGRVILATGLGILSADYALIGALGANRYSRINGLRSEIEGIGAWVGLGSLDSERIFTEDGRLKTVSLHLRSPEPLRVGRQLNLTIRPAYRYGPGEHPDETTINERMLVETRVSSPRDWEDHLCLHSAVRDLIRVSAWRSFNFQDHEATRDDDPLRTIDGTSHGRQWYKVDTFRTGMAPKSSTSGHIGFLFSFDDIGPTGVAKWMRLKERMSRGINPILRLLELREATIETHFAQLGIGLEALGFTLARDAGLSIEKAGNESFELRLRRLAADCPGSFPIDEDAWVTDMRRLYNSVKHANRALPEPSELFKAYWESLLVFRYWIAGRLGLRKSALKANLRIDRMASRVATG